MNLNLIGYIVPGLIVLGSIPMAVGKVPPNWFYGFRTSKTLRSPGVWYPANRFAGWAMIAAGVLTLGVNLLVWPTHPDWPPQKLVRWMWIDLLVWLLLAAAACLLYLRRLPE